MTNKLSATTKLYRALTNGAKMTTKQITARFKLVNPSAQIARLRNEGMDIVNSNGKYQKRQAA